MKFQTLLEKCHIKDACTSAKKTQSNAICKRMHQTVGNVLRTLLHGEPPQNIKNAKEEHLINENLMSENQKRRRYNYIPQQKVLKKTWKPQKLGMRTTDLYTILQTHVNGTVTIELQPGISERLNIQRIISYKE